MKEGEYNDLDCKHWKNAFQAPDIDIYDKSQGAVWCCSECHYIKHNQMKTRRAPVPMGPNNKEIWLYLTVCCAVGAKCRKS